MKYNAHTHILDHAQFILDTLKSRNDKLVHFNTSVDATYFIKNGSSSQISIDKIMIDILKNVLKRKIVVEEKNGTPSKKDGTKVQRYRKRTINFDDMLAAYHNRHFNSSKSVMPHFHFLLGKNARVGKNFMYLKQALEDEAKKYGIKFNFMEDKQVTGLSKYQMQRVEKLSWIMNQGDTKKIKHYLSHKNELNHTLDLLVTHYKNTQNLSFFIKTLSILNQRLQELNINYIYKDTNLMDNIFFFLSEDQLKKLNNIKSGRSVDLDLNKVLDREILKYTYGFKSDVMNILIDTFQINDISKSQLYYKKNQLNKNQINKKSKNSFRDLVIKDIRHTLAHAVNEKKWKDLLIEMGYEKVSIKSLKKSNNKREKIGLNLTTQKKTKLFISFSEISLDYLRITSILMYNTKKAKRKNKLESHLKNYHPVKIKHSEFFTKFEYKMKMLLQIYSHEASKQFNIDNLKNLAHKYDIYASDMYDITTFENQKVTIVDDRNKITLKRYISNTKQNAISDMLDIAEIKGWNLNTVIINGSDEFIIEVKKQITNRTKSSLNRVKGDIKM